MVALQDAGIAELGGASLREYWQTSVNDLAVKTGAAETSLRSDQLVRSSLEARNSAVSGVSLDEEAIDLMSLQRQTFCKELNHKELQFTLDNSKGFFTP